MAAGRLGSVMRYLRRVAAPAAGEESDGQLLGRFIARRDEAAFAALVERHGPMVLAVCRRVLGDVHDAEDAFQATFLVLVRKATSIVRPDRLGPWLYGVTYRTALEVRGRRARRRANEKEATDMPAAPATAEEAATDLRPILDEEVGRLPAKYRVPFVLCYLEG